MYPTLEKVKEIAASGQYRRVPVCKELYADRYTPVEVMRVLRKASKHCYLLESASQTEVWGRFSFLGYEPAMEIHLYGWSPEYPQNRGGYGCDKESGTSGRYSAGDY